MTLALDLPSLAEAIFSRLIPSLFVYVIWELSDNVTINPLPMCLKKNPATLDGFQCWNLKTKKKVVF